MLDRVGTGCVILLCAGCASAVRAPVHAEHPVEAPPPVAAERAAPIPHPVLAAYRETVREILTEDERRQLDEVSMEDTLGGDSQRLRYIAADRTIRELLPLALEAQEDPTLDRHAERLRALPPLLNRDVDYVAQPIVARAVRALRAYHEGAPLEREAEVGPGPADPPTPVLDATEDPDALSTAVRQEVDPDDARAYAEALAEYTEAYGEAFGTSPLQADAATAAAADAVDAGFLLRRAVEEYGVDRQLALASALDTLTSMADAARRRERMPAPSHDGGPTADRP